MSGFDMHYISNSKRVRGDHEPQFLGRNGGGIQTGVEAFVYITHTGYKKVTITPISTRGLAQCYIEIPVSELREFANELIRLADEEEQGQEQRQEQG